MLLIQSVISGD